LRPQARGYWHSVSLQKFFVNRAHKKVCPCCGKPSALLLEHCSFCNEALGDEHIRPTGRDPLVEAVLGPSTGGSEGFVECHRSFEVLVLQHRFPVGRQHLLALPKNTCYDLRQLRRRQLPLLRKLRTKGLACLRERLGWPEVGPEPPALCGFSYPADYNHLHMHLVAPPFTSTGLFNRFFFHAWEEVEAELERYGQVRVRPTVDPEGEELLAQRVEALDSAARARASASK